MSIVASDYYFGYDGKVLFEKTYCYSAYEAFGVPSPLTEVETTEDCETRLGAIREFIIPGGLVIKSPDFQDLQEIPVKGISY